MSITLYEKRGRRYVPVAEHVAWDSYPRGAHLVVCRPGGTLQRFHVEPDHAGLLAAAEPLRGQICELVREKLEMRPAMRPVTPKQMEAWQAFKRAMGVDRFVVEYAGVGELADAVVDLVVGSARESTPCL